MSEALPLTVAVPEITCLQCGKARYPSKAAAVRAAAEQGRVCDTYELHGCWHLTHKAGAPKRRRRTPTITIGGDEYSPVDSVAARVIAPAPQWVDLEPIKGEGGSSFLGMNPPGITQRPPTVEDLTGQRKGSIVIVGYIGDGKTKHRWLGLCLCGGYVAREGKAWRKAMRAQNYAPDLCENCMRLTHLRTQAKKADRRHLSSTGEWPRCPKCKRKVPPGAKHVCP